MKDQKRWKKKRRTQYTRKQLDQIETQNDHYAYIIFVLCVIMGAWAIVGVLS